VTGGEPIFEDTSVAIASTKSYRDLLIWQRGMDLAAVSYKIANGLPDYERYGLASQIRRSAVSIPANIAEGYGREIDGPFAQHLRIAQGSLKELETHFLLVQRLGLEADLPITSTLDHCDELGRMIRSMIRSLKDR
jgi:four helix bundle protein